MKLVALREAKQSLSGFIDRAQRERVLITRHGKPAALVIGVEGREIEELLLAQDPRFWELIERRRKEGTMALSEARAHLGASRRKPFLRKKGRRPSRS